MKYIYISFIALFFSCSTSKNFKIESKFIDNNNVYAWYDKEKEKVWALSFPILLNLTNDNIKKELIYYQYNYQESKRGKAISLYEIKDNNMILVDNFKKKEINPNETTRFLIITKHIITDSELANQIISKLNKKNLSNDSISIGSFKKFRKEYVNSVKNLVNKDTLYLRFKFLEKNNNKKKRIKVPIKIQ